MKIEIKLLLAGAFSIVGTIVHGETYTENKELSGPEPMVIAEDFPLELEVAPGATVTVSRVISGAGKLVKKGGGTLILAAKNLFEGGVDFVAGDIWARSEGAFGSGQVTFTGEGVVGSLIFDAPDAKFDNDFLVAKKTACPKLPTNQAGEMGTFVFLSNAVMNGNITFTQNVVYGGIGPGYKGDATVVFNGNIDASPISRFSLVAYGTMIFNGWIKAANPSMYTASSASGIIRFNNSDNELLKGDNAQSDIGMYCPTIICGAPNVIYDVSIQAYYNFNHNQNTIDLNGFSQSIKALSFNYNKKTPPGAANDETDLCVKSDKPAMLTLTGTGKNNTTYSNYAFAEMISVTLDADPAYTLVLSNRTHSLKGGITVLNGIMQAVDAASFPNMTFLDVSEGAEFSLSTSVADAMRRVNRSKIEGSLVLESTAVQNLANCNMEIGENASITLPESAAVTVRTLAVNGVKMQNGTYGPEQIAQLKSGSIKVAGPAWPEIVEPVYVIEVQDGTTNQLDEMTVSVTQDGETRSVAFPELAPTTGTIRKIGDGTVFSSQGLSNFTGRILIEDGVFAVDDKLQTGPTNASDTAEVWVKDGATFLLSGTLSTCGANNLKLSNKFHLSGSGHNGAGAVRSELDAKQTRAFYRAEWHLGADATVGIDGKAERFTLYGMNIYMNGHSMAVKTDTAVGDGFVFESTHVHALGCLTMDRGTFLPQGADYWYSMEPACIAMTNNAILSFYKSKNNYGHEVKVWFTPGGKYKWNSSGDSASQCVPGKIDINWWNGPVVVDGALSVCGTTNKKGLDLRGKVSGSGSLCTLGAWLHLQNPANDFTFDLSVAPSSENAYKDFENGLAVYANGALPLSCRGVAITNAMFQLYGDARFDLPKLECCAKGDTNLAFSCSSDVKGGTLAGLKKTGAGTLTYEVPLAVTGVVDVAEGILDTDGNTLKAGTLTPNAGRIDGDVEVLYGVACPVASVVDGKIGKLTVDGKVTFAENSKLDIDELVLSGVLARWNEHNVLIEADSIEGTPSIDPDSVAANRRWRVSVLGGTVSVFRTCGTIFSIR